MQYDKTEKWVYIYFKIQTKYNTIKLRKSIYLLQTSNNIQYDKTKKRVYKVNYLNVTVKLIVFKVTLN